MNKEDHPTNQPDLQDEGLHHDDTSSQEAVEPNTATEHTLDEKVTEQSIPLEKTLDTTEPSVPVNHKRCKVCGKYACVCPNKKASKCNATRILAVLALICGVGGLGLSLYDHFSSSKNQPITFNSGPDGNSANFVEGSIADVANKVSPSVVSITTETRTQGWYGQSTSSAAGTGFIITSDGYVLTNRHVAEGASNISVVMDDGTTYNNVKLVGTDPLNDAAILKINDVKDLPAVKLGDSKTVTIGQEVIAIGNALGVYQNTVTSGIISGTGRSLVASDSTGSSYETLSDMIQTDAAINQGNSGGPLVNAAGEVIGINTAVSSANGIGFAIPISSVKGIIKSVTTTGEFKRAYLGVRYTDLNPEIAKERNLNTTAGAYVSSGSSNSPAVVKGSAAEKAGIKEGDIIIAVNGVKIGKSGSLSSLLGEYTVGDTVQLTLLRDGKEENVNVTLQEYSTKSNSSEN